MDLVNPSNDEVLKLWKSCYDEDEDDIDEFTEEEIASKPCSTIHFLFKLIAFSLVAMSVIQFVFISIIVLEIFSIHFLTNISIIIARENVSFF